MKIVSFTDLYCCFITFYCSILFYFTLCHVLSIMMFKCTLMKEQINFLKSNQGKLFSTSWLQKRLNILYFTLEPIDLKTKMIKFA